MDTKEAAEQGAPAHDDITSFDTVVSGEEGAVMELRNPKTGDVMRHDDGRPFTITYRGRDTETVRDTVRKLADKRISSTMRTRAPVLSAVAERDDVEVLVSATMSWDIILGGQKPKDDPNEYRKVYIRYPWIKEQGDEFISVRANFIKSS